MCKTDTTKLMTVEVEGTRIMARLQNKLSKNGQCELFLNVHPALAKVHKFCGHLIKKQPAPHQTPSLDNCFGWKTEAGKDVRLSIPCNCAYNDRIGTCIFSE